MATAQQPLTYNRERLIELIKEHALKFGDFTLASGKKSQILPRLSQVDIGR